MPWFFKHTNKWREYGYDVTWEYFKRVKPKREEYKEARTHLEQYGVLLSVKDHVQFKSGVNDALILLNIDRYAFWTS